MHRWLTEVSPTFVWDWPHLLRIQAALNEVTAGRLKRLMLFLPPRHGKSHLATIRYPVYRLEHDPTMRVIIGAYNTTLAEKFSRQARRIAERRLTLSSERTAAGDWETAAGGGLRAVGVGSGVTGTGADLIVIDDPVKSRAEANSEAYRERCWEWYTNDLYTRLEPGGSIILIMCMASGTRVATPHGWRNIEDLQPGEQVWSYPVGNAGLEKRVVKAVIEQLPAVTYTISTGNSSVRATARHPFLVVRGGRRWSKNDGEWPTHDGGDPHDWRFEWVQAQDIHPGDVVATLKSTPGGSRKRIPGTHMFMDAEYMWMLGYLWGDGWVTRYVRHKQNGSVSYSVCCAKGIYPDRNERYLAIVKRSYDHVPYLTGGGYYRSDSNRFGRDMEALGLIPGIGAKDKCLPRWLWQTRADGKRAFLRGLLDADGCKVKAGKQYRFGSSSISLVSDARELALTCGVRPTNIYYEHLIGVQPPNSPRPIDADFWQVGLTFAHTQIERKHGFRNQPAGRVIRFANVTSVEIGTEPEPTWDLALDGLDENFIANGFIVHNTRWHTDDLAGRILHSDDAASWNVISLPALAEGNDPLGRKEGEALCPARYNEAALKKIQLVVLDDFTALYQQRPLPAGGAFFQRAWWDEQNRYDAGDARHYNRCVGRWISIDTALKDKETSDYSAFAVLELTPEYTLNVRSVIHERLQFPELIRRIETLATQYNRDGKLRGVVIEDKVSGTSAFQTLQAVAPALPLIAFQPNGSKEYRWQQASAWCERGMVAFPDPGDAVPWLLDFESELFTAPAAAHDDMTDAFSQGVIYLEHLLTAGYQGRVRTMLGGNQ